MKILVGSIGHESNTFSPLPTRWADFTVIEGQALLEERSEDSLTGIMDTLRDAGRDLLPSIKAYALPGGLVEREAFERLKQRLLSPAAEADAACLFLHGAMRAKGVDYGDTELLTALRAVLGPEKPITLAMDMHANITEAMIHDANALVTYHTAPHIDRYETGQRAAQLLLETLSGEIRPAIGLSKLPMLLPGEMAQTSLDPMRSLMAQVEQIASRPGICACSLSKTHCWADIPDQGISAVVVTDGDPDKAYGEADRLTAAFWEQRAAFQLSAEAYGPAQSVQVALSAPEPTVFLSDSGDNPGAGGTTDLVVLLEALLEAGASDTLVAAIWDRPTYETCQAAGPGESVTINLGAKVNTAHGAPLHLSGCVRHLDDGAYDWQGQGETTYHGEMGPLAVLQVQGIDIVVSRDRVSMSRPAQLRALGLDPLAYKIVVLKRGYLTAPFQAISPRSILVLTPGPTNCDITQLAYHRVRRPIYPLNPDMTWAP